MEQPTELIVVKQIPVIEDQLRSVKTAVQARVTDALSLVCTEETYKDIKKERAALRSEYAAFEAKRKEVKAAIMGPYESFESVYKDCVGSIYADADKKLKAKIDAVEDGLKQQKMDDLLSFFNEYRDSLGIDEGFAPFSASGITVTLSDSRKNLHTKAQVYLDRVLDDLALISAQEYQDDILVEYRRTHNASASILAVVERHKAADEEKARREAAAAEEAARAAAAQAVAQVVEEETPDMPIPTAAPDPEPVQDAAPPVYPVLRVTFTVTATKPKLLELRDFLRNGGYEYVNG